ncbi:hypothetical protein TgHK011_003858 [Trichoderma gracile]|nr:hypothetical protein TgHK011_003858 [Trichoderma gracile]
MDAPPSCEARTAASHHQYVCSASCGGRATERSKYKYRRRRAGVASASKTCTGLAGLQARPQCGAARPQRYLHTMQAKRVRA